MRYALINNNLVENIIEAEPTFIPGITGYQFIIEAGEMVGIGWEYDGENFIAPDVPTPPTISEPKLITLLALNLRMTRAERDAIRAAEQSDGDVSDVMYLMRQARYIDLERAETIAGLQMLEAKELLGVGRADEILTAPIQDIEKAVA